MSNEITVTASLACNTGTGVLGFSESEVASGLQFTLTAATGVYVKGTMATSTSPAAIPVGAIVTPRYLWVKNLDATNNIRIRAASGAADTVDLYPGDVALLPFKTNTPYATASASTPQLAYFFIGANA